MAIVEFSIFPLGKGESVSRYVADAIDIIDKSGVDYRITSMGTILEGDLKVLIPIILKCHNAVLKKSNRVITTIKIDDRKGAKGRISKKIESVENILKRSLRK